MKKQKPELIAVHSRPGKHSVLLDGQLRMRDAGTEVECVRWLQRHVDGWPTNYVSTGPAVGRADDCIAYFERHTKLKCKGRTPGNVLTSYACSRYARQGSDWCYWHDPATEAERMERTRKAVRDRKLEREDREKRQKQNAKKEETR